MHAFLHRIKGLFKPSSFITTVMVLSTLPLIFVMYLTYSISEKSLLSSIENNLQLIVSDKAAAIDTYIYHTQAAAEALALNPIIIDNVLKLTTTSPLSEGEKKAIDVALDPVFDSFQPLIHYKKIYIITDHQSFAFGDQLSDAALTQRETAQLLRVATERAKTVLESELYTLPDESGLVGQNAIMAVPVAFQGKVVAVLAFELDNEEIYKIIHATYGASASMEVIVGTWEAIGEILLAAPLRFNKSKAKLLMSDSNESRMVAYLKAAFQGKEQQAIFSDYRHKEVIAVTKYLPALRWGMMVKVDAAEAFTSILSLRREIVWVGTISLLSLALLAYLLSKKLEHSQQLLIQQEKLASIGVLTAGVAHEINNPINFITSNISSLKIDIQELLHIINQYGATTQPADIQRIHALKQEMEFDTTQHEIDTLLQGIEEGANRVAVIVKDLKTISRLHDTDLKRVDITEGINSTLVLLSHTYKNKIQIIKDFGPIPPIECYPGKINQVLMNLLSNAIQAIDGEGTIHIATAKQGEMVEIRIKDSGCGISEKNRKSIFLPFFTTKEVGKGTGLGLSITHAIIIDHKGKITFQSQEGEGTEFTVRLPIDQPRRSGG
jgi:signal transduction histidine kinase